MATEADKNRKLDFEEIQIPPGPRLGNLVVEVNDLSKGFGDRVLFEDLSFSLPRNGIVGVLGPNGVGKTTLFKMIVGEEQPDDGTIEIGETVTVSYVDQNRDGILPRRRTSGRRSPTARRSSTSATWRSRAGRTGDSRGRTEAVERRPVRHGADHRHLRPEPAGERRVWNPRRDRYHQWPARSQMRRQA